MTKIPSEEEFERADRKAKERWRNLETVREQVLQHFARRCPLYDFHILPQGSEEFRAYIFFAVDQDIVKCGKSGITKQIEDFVFEQLELAGRGRRGEVKVEFEVDSDENVRAKFGGNYYNRLL